MSVTNTFGTEYDQRVIAKFLWNERADVREIAGDCMHSLLSIVINFERIDSGLQRHRLVVKTCIMKFLPEDLHLMILTRQFWRYWTNFRLNSNQCIRWPRDSLLFIQQCCGICMNSLGSNRSICIEFRICEQMMSLIIIGWPRNLFPWSRKIQYS
jgi:hypothetical protein